MRPVVPILSLRLLARKVPSLPSFWFVNAAVLPTVFGSMRSPVRTTLPLKSTVNRSCLTSVQSLAKPSWLYQT